LLFIGPGSATDRQLDGAFLVSPEDRANPLHKDEVTGKTLSEEVRDQFGITSFLSAHVVMVNVKSLNHATSLGFL